MFLLASDFWFFSPQKETTWEILEVGAWVCWQVFTRVQAQSNVISGTQANRHDFARTQGARGTSKDPRSCWINTHEDIDISTNWLILTAVSFLAFIFCYTFFTCMSLPFMFISLFYLLLLPAFSLFHIYFSSVYVRYYFSVSLSCSSSFRLIFIPYLLWLVYRCHFRRAFYPFVLPIKIVLSMYLYS
jgi:hypothetical protein